LICLKTWASKCHTPYTSVEASSCQCDNM
jgi:hypothetical protein